MKKFWLGVLTGIATMTVLPLVVVATGMINMGASTRPTSLERGIAALAIKASMYWRTPNDANCLANNREARKAGLEHYRSMCVRCHRGPGVQPEEFSEGLNPPVPILEHAGNEFTDAELFWITKHGIRMTAMPAFGATHKDEEIWKIVEAVKALDSLTAEEKEQLKTWQHDKGDQHGH